MCAIYWLISTFSCLCLHSSAPLVFCYVLKWVVWMGLLLIATGMCFGFILLANQEMLYWQANQKRWQLRVVFRVDMFISVNGHRGGYIITELSGNFRFLPVSDSWQSLEAIYAQSLMVKWFKKCEKTWPHRNIFNGNFEAIFMEWY